MVMAIDERDVDWRALERPRRRQAAEAAADDDDPRGRHEPHTLL